MDHAQERRLFATSLLLSAGLHLALVGLGVMTGWGRSLSPPAVLEVKLMSPPALEGEGQGAGGSPSAAPLASPAPAVKKKAVVRKPPPVPPPKLTRAEKPATGAALTLTVPARPQSAGPPLTGSAAIQGQAEGAGAGGVSASLGAVSGQGGGSHGGGFGGGGQGHYLSLIRSRILAQRHYPTMAREKQQEGVVRVRFSLAPSGALNPGVEVVRPSGFNLLDEQARQCVLAATPFPPFPRDVNQDHLTIEVPIVYRLTDRE